MKEIIFLAKLIQQKVSASLSLMLVQSLHVFKVQIISTKGCIHIMERRCHTTTVICNTWFTIFINLMVKKSSLFFPKCQKIINDVCLTSEVEFCDLILRLKVFVGPRLCTYPYSSVYTLWGSSSMCFKHENLKPFNSGLFFLLLQRFPPIFLSHPRFFYLHCIEEMSVQKQGRILYKRTNFFH